MSTAFDQIDWKQMGVFTEESTFNELLVVYIISTLGFTVAYYLNKMFYGDVVAAIFGKDSPYFKLDLKN